jgi:hypothetical protein
VEFHLPTQIKILRSFETSACVSPATQHNILGDQNRQTKFLRQPLLYLKRLFINPIQPFQTCTSFAHVIQLEHSCATCTTRPPSPQILTSSDVQRTYRAEARTNDSPRDDARVTDYIQNQCWRSSDCCLCPPNSSECSDVTLLQAMAVGGQTSAGAFNRQINQQVLVK